MWVSLPAGRAQRLKARELNKSLDLLAPCASRGRNPGLPSGASGPHWSNGFRSGADGERPVGQEAPPRENQGVQRQVARHGRWRICVRSNPSLKRRPHTAWRPGAAQGSRRLHCPARRQGTTPCGSP